MSQNIDSASDRRRHVPRVCLPAGWRGRALARCAYVHGRTRHPPGVVRDGRTARGGGILCAPPRPVLSRRQRRDRSEETLFRSRVAGRLDGARASRGEHGEHDARHAGVFRSSRRARPKVRRADLRDDGLLHGRGAFRLPRRAISPIASSRSPSYHGGGLATDSPDSPHLLAPAIQARVYIGGAIEDRGFDDAQKERLGRALTDAGVDHVIETYQARHGWVPSDTPVHDPVAAERHWETLLELFGQNFVRRGRLRGRSAEEEGGTRPGARCGRGRRGGGNSPRCAVRKRKAGGGALRLPVRGAEEEGGRRNSTRCAVRKRKAGGGTRPDAQCGKGEEGGRNPKK